MRHTRPSFASLGPLVAAFSLIAVAAAAGCKGPADAPHEPAAGSMTAPEEAAPGSPTAAPSAPGAASGGMKAYVDPETGKLTDEPPPGAEPLPGDVLAPPPSARPRPAPGGGEMIETAPPSAGSDGDGDEGGN